MKTVLSLMCCSLIWVSVAHASDSVSDDLAQRLALKLHVLLPDAEISSINKTPIDDLYEVVVGASITYMSADGKYAFSGDLIDIDGLSNLTSQRRKTARAQLFADLDEGDYIEFAPTGRTKRSIYVFTDIDCGYCRKMHQEVRALNDGGVAVRYLAFPRSGVVGESYEKLVSVWCSKDQHEAMTTAKAGQSVKSPQCDNPVKNHFSLGESLGIRGTPAVYLENGDQIGGFRSAKDILAEYVRQDS